MYNAEFNAYLNALVIFLYSCPDLKAYSVVLIELASKEHREGQRGKKSEW